MSDKYILDEEGNAVPEHDLLKWAAWFEDATNRVVAKDSFGKIKVSTVFLGLDHSFDEGEPILWETMVFGGELDQEMDRYGSLEDAKEGHKKMCELVKENGKK